MIDIHLFKSFSDLQCSEKAKYVINIQNFKEFQVSSFLSYSFVNFLTYHSVAVVVILYISICILKKWKKKTFNMK